MTTELLDETKLSFSEPDLIQSICRESFYQFVREFWDIAVAEDPHWNWHHEYLCGELQRVAERVFRNEAKEADHVTNISPGTTKSTIYSIMYPPWIWTRMPSARCITPSFEQDLALNFSRKSRDIVRSERYQNAFRFKKSLKGKWEPSTDPDATPLTLRDDQDAKGFYENMAGGFRRAVGAGGSIIGRHAHFIIVDDPIDPESTFSEADLKRINRWMEQTLPSRKVNKEVCPTILVMQRLHENDPTGAMLEKALQPGKNVKHICLPAKLRENVKPTKLRLKYVDGFMDPIRLNQKVLDEAMADLGQYGYAGQYDQDPAPPGGGMFKVDKIQIGMPPPSSKFIRIVRYWDKAGTSAKDNAGAAHTVGLKMGLTMENGQKHWWILDVLRGQWDSGTRETLIRQTAKADGPNVILATEQEPGSGGKESAENTVNNNVGSVIRIDRPVGDKVRRADPFSVQVNWGYVHVVAGAAWWPTYRDELRLFPFSKFKDQTDASSGAFSVVNRQRVGAL